LDFLEHRAMEVPEVNTVVMHASNDSQATRHAVESRMAQKAAHIISGIVSRNIKVGDTKKRMAKGLLKEPFVLRQQGRTTMTVKERNDVGIFDSKA
jgi:hypothetical protein